MVGMNVFRILGDVSHTASKCILIWAIHWNKSSEGLLILSSWCCGANTGAGVSLITQVLYVAVFVTRYLDLFWVPPGVSYWNFTLKNFYILSSIYIIILMLRVYARTREREKAWKLGGYAAGGSLVAAPFVTMIFRGLKFSTPSEMLWTFSIILEAFCILPQLLLLRQTTVPTVIDSYYLLTLGSYRAFYIGNWIVRGVKEHQADPISIIFGVIQTLFYLDFAWVYWSRQRVKLRGGGVVDSDDLRKSWLVNKVIGAGRTSLDGDVESEPAADGNRASNTPRNSRWGQRGVSVSADDTLDDHMQKQKATTRRQDVGGTQQEFQSMLGQEEEPETFSDADDDDAPHL